MAEKMAITSAMIEKVFAPLLLRAGFEPLFFFAAMFLFCLRVSGVKKRQFQCFD